MIKLFIFTVFTSLSVFAGNGFGTMKTANSELKQAIQGSQTIFTKDPKSVLQNGSTQIIYTINRKDSVTEFAVANAIDNKWEVQKYAVPDSAIENSDFSQLINQSSSVQDWVEIQK